MLGVIFFLYDFLYRLWYGLFLPSKRAGKLLLFHTKTYRGRSVHLSDGPDILPGDLIIVLHFDNLFIKKLYRVHQGNKRKVLLALASELTSSLALLRTRILDDISLRPVRALMGETLLGERGRQFGFDVFPLQGSTRRARLALRNALAIRKRTVGSQTPDARTNLHGVVEVWISREKLIQWYAMDAKK